MQRKRLGYILIGGGLVMALSVGVMVYSQVSEAERVRASLPTARVVIATVDIPERTEIAASMVNVRTVPDELVQQVRLACVQAWNSGWLTRGLDRRTGQLSTNPFERPAGEEQSS